MGNFFLCCTLFGISLFLLLAQVPKVFAADTGLQMKAVQITPVIFANPTGTIGNPLDTCGGKYSLNNPLHENFGDPACNFTKNDLYNLLQEFDPKNAFIWFFEVVPCEAPGYNPNAEQVVDPIDPAHAWGLFQMGRGLNGPYDHGDVIWTQQATNAITYNDMLLSHGVGWHYWYCAKAHWQ